MESKNFEKNTCDIARVLCVIEDFIEVVRKNDYSKDASYKRRIFWELVEEIPSIALKYSDSPFYDEMIDLANNPDRLTENLKNNPDTLSELEILSRLIRKYF